MDAVEIVDSLGKCENCGRLTSITEFADEDCADARWMCTCGHELTHTSFGYDKGDHGAKKVRWIGPDGNWTPTKPAEYFKLGKIEVMIRLGCTL